MGTLAVFLDAAARTPFAWGRRDCVLFFCDWVRLATGVDPAARFRGRYATRLGALRIIGRAGGLLALVSAEMARAGFGRTSEPEAGDVGVVMTVTVGGQVGAVGAVFDGARWVVLGQGGLIAAPMTPLSIWRIAWPKR